MSGRKGLLGVPGSVVFAWALGTANAVAAPAVAAPAVAAPADSVVTGDRLRELQREDDAFYGDDLLDVDPVLRDTALTSLGRLGLEAYGARARAQLPWIRFGFEPLGELFDYHRVEGLVIGAGIDITSPRWHEAARLHLEGAYATGPEKGRWLAAATLPLAGELELELEFADRVVPFGSNRPHANFVRAVVGGADERDYMRELGGSARLAWRRGILRARTGYEAVNQTAVPVTEDFGIFGDMDQTNPEIDEGIVRAVSFGATLGTLGDQRTALAVDYAVAGGGLGGIQTFQKLDAGLDLRRYVLGSWEVWSRSSLTHVGGSPPVQDLADAGGVSTVRGFARRSRVGRAGFRQRLEAPVPYNVFKASTLPLLRRLEVQIVPWADAARAWDAGNDTWLTAFGVGFQQYLGPFGNVSFLRLDVAFPTGPERPDDVRVFVRFERGLF